MRYTKLMNTPIATISRKVSKGEELVVVRRRDFEAYRKWQAETAEALSRSREAKKLKHKGKLLILRSLKDWR